MSLVTGVLGCFLFSFLSCLPNSFWYAEALRFTLRLTRLSMALIVGVVLSDLASSAGIPPAIIMARIALQVGQPISAPTVGLGLVPLRLSHPLSLLSILL